MNNSYPIGKVQINFAQYDEKTHKQTQLLEYYFDFSTALYLSNLILSGRLDRMIKEAEHEGTFKGRPVNDYTSYFEDLSGVNCEDNADKWNKYKARFGWLNEHSSVSRQFKVQKSSKYKYMFRLEYGNGKKEGTGIIKPIEACKTYIQIPLTEKDAIAFAKTIEMDLAAYRTQYYIKFADKLFNGQKCEVYDRSYSQEEMSVDTPANADNTASKQVLPSQGKNKFGLVTKGVMMPKANLFYVDTVNKADNTPYALYFNKDSIETIGKDKWDKLIEAVSQKEVRLNVIADINGKALLFKSWAIDT